MEVEEIIKNIKDSLGRNCKEISLVSKFGDIKDLIYIEKFFFDRFYETNLAIADLNNDYNKLTIKSIFN